MAQPIISWYEVNNATEITGTIDWGTIDAGSDSPEKVFHIWNNRNGAADVSKMEEVTFTTRDRAGGLGNTVGSIVEAVKDDWFRVKVATLNETEFKQVGSGLSGTTNNPSGVKAVGTTGKTKNPKAATAVTWTGTAAKVVGDIVKPTVDNGFIYEVTISGTTGAAQPTWTTTEGNTVTDGSVTYLAIQIEKQPATQEILGLANSVLPNGTNVADGAGNFITVAVFASIPDNASAGKNELVKRVSYRYV